MRYSAIQRTVKEREVFDIHSATSGVRLYSLETTLDRGACYLSPDEEILVLHSRRWFLGETDDQLDFYAAGTGSYLHGLYSVVIEAITFSPDGRQIYRREVYPPPARSKKDRVGFTHILDAFSGATLEIRKDDGHLASQGFPPLPIPFQ